MNAQNLPQFVPGFAVCVETVISQGRKCFGGFGHLLSPLLYFARSDVTSSTAGTPSTTTTHTPAKDANRGGGTSSIAAVAVSGGGGAAKPSAAAGTGSPLGEFREGQFECALQSEIWIRLHDLLGPSSVCVHLANNALHNVAVENRTNTYIHSEHVRPRACVLSARQDVVCVCVI